MSLPVVNHLELDQSSSASTRLSTVHGVIMATTRGLSDKPYLITTVDQLNRVFGGYSAEFPYYPELQRALRRGVSFYILRAVPEGATPAGHNFTTNKVQINAKSAGTWGNALKVRYSLANSVHTLSVSYTTDPSQDETWTADTFANLVTKVNNASNLVQVTLEATYTALDSQVDYTALTGGTAGNWGDGILGALDFSKFNDLTDLDTISQTLLFTASAAQAAIEYAESRKDLVAVIEVDPTSSPIEAVNFMMTPTMGLGGVSSSYAAVYYGSSLTAWSTEAKGDVAGPVLLDVLSVWSQSDTMAGNRLLAPAGPSRGLIDGVKTFAFNLLSPARKAEADNLANVGCNVVGSHPNYGPVVWGAKTLNRKGKAMDNIHVRRLFLELAHNITPIYQKGLFELNNPKTWRVMYLAVKPILDNLVRANIIAPAYAYVGDQDASRISDVAYNTPENIMAGIYKTKISMVPYGYIEGITFTLVANSITGTISFE